MTPEQKKTFLLDEIETLDNSELTNLTPNTGAPVIAPDILATLGPNTTAGQSGEDNTPAEEAEAIEGEEMPNEEEAASDDVTFNLAEFLDPATVIELINWIIPVVIVFVTDKRGWGIEQEDMQFSEEQKKTLAKPLKKAFKETTTKTKNPWLALVIVLIAMIATQLFTAYQKAKERDESGENYEDMPPAPGAKKKKAQPKKRGRKPKGYTPDVEPQNDIILPPPQKK